MAASHLVAPDMSGGVAPYGDLVYGPAWLGQLTPGIRLGSSNSPVLRDRLSAPRLALDRDRVWEVVHRLVLGVGVPEGHLLDKLDLRAEEGPNALSAMDAADRLAK